MSRTEAIEASRRSLRLLFRGTIDSEAETLINEIVRQCDPPIRVVTESTWAQKFGGLVHCAVCQEVLGARVALPRESNGRCPEHADWKIFYLHHSWSPTELHNALVTKLREWLAAYRQKSDGTSDAVGRA